MTAQRSSQSRQTGGLVRIVGSIVWGATLAKLLKESRSEDVSVAMHPEAVSLEAGLPRTCRDLIILSAENGSVEEIQSVVDRLEWLRNNCPAARAVVVGPAAVRYGWELREAGAVAVVDHVWRAATIARIAVLHLQHT